MLFSRISRTPKRGTRSAEMPITKVSRKTRGDYLLTFFITEFRAIRPRREAKEHQNPIQSPYYTFSKSCAM